MRFIALVLVMRFIALVIAVHIIALVLVMRFIALVIAVRFIALVVMEMGVRAQPCKKGLTDPHKKICIVCQVNKRQPSKQKTAK